MRMKQQQTFRAATSKNFSHKNKEIFKQEKFEIGNSIEKIVG